MSPNVRKILIGVLVALMAYQAWGWVRDTVFGPLMALESRSSQLADAIDKKRVTQRRIVKAAKDLKVWNSRSLNPDRLAAPTLYQTWLIELAGKHKLTGVAVTPGRVESRPKADTYYSIPATVKAEGTFKQLGDFLYEFHKSGLLHRVNSIVMATSKHSGDPALTVTMEVEGLSLLKSKPRTTLASADLQPAELKPRSEYDATLVKNLFVRGYNGPPAPTSPKTEIARPSQPVKPSEPPFDQKEFVRLVASVVVDGRGEAWLYDQSSNTRTDLSLGGSFKVAGLEGRVVAMESDLVQLQIGPDTFELQLGKSLKDLRKLPSASAPTKTEPATTESGKTEPGKAESGKVEAGKVDPRQAEPSRTEAKPSPKTEGGESR